MEQSQRITDIESAAKEVVNAWREWHKTPDKWLSQELIEACHELDVLFPGKTAANIVDERS